MVRISAAIAAVVFAVLLGFVVADTFGRPSYVVPTNGVTDGGRRDALPAGKEGAEALRERAELQRWRAETGPSPTAPNPPALAGSSAPPAATAGAEPGLPLEWAAERGHDWDLLRPPRHLEGSVNLPQERARILVQPEGRTWRRIHDEQIYFGGWVIFGVSLILALFLLLRGRIPLELGFSGTTIKRFSALERSNHWMTATSFIMMVLTGLVILYGRHLLKPIIGATGFNAAGTVSLYIHIAFAGPFVLGVLVMIALWLRQNLPTRLDLHWLAHFGGFLTSDPVKPPARRFNAGQKLVFWGVTIGGLLLVASGISLMLPFFWLDIQGMQIAMVAHSAIALLMIGLIIGHIYIGTVGMVGAFDAMWTGEVDRNWAEEHHTLWLAELEGRTPAELQGEMEAHRRGSPQPAE